MEWFSFKMLNNSIEFSCLFLPYTGEHRVGYWSKFKYNNRLDWKKRRPIGLSLNLCCDFFFFSWGSFSSSGCRGIPKQLLLLLHFFSQVHICHFPLCETMCRRKTDPCFLLTLAVINISVIIISSLKVEVAATSSGWGSPLCLCGVTQISSALTLSSE